MRWRKKAKENGLFAEEIAKEQIRKKFKADPIFLNDLIDFTVNGRYIEVKSCEGYVKDSHASRKVRAGRFLLRREQHNFLLEKEGWYLFIVTCPKGRKYIRFMPANAIEPFESRYKLIRWTKIFYPEREEVD